MDDENDYGVERWFEKEGVVLGNTAKGIRLAASVDEDGMSSDLPLVSLPFVKVIVITSSVRYFANGFDVLSMIRLDGILYYAQERLLLQGLRFDCKQMFVYEGY